VRDHEDEGGNPPTKAFLQKKQGSRYFGQPTKSKKKKKQSPPLQIEKAAGADLCQNHIQGNTQKREVIRAPHSKRRRQTDLKECLVSPFPTQPSSHRMGKGPWGGLQAAPRKGTQVEKSPKIHCKDLPKTPPQKQKKHPCRTALPKRKKP